MKTAEEILRDDLAIDIKVLTPRQEKRLSNMEVVIAKRKQQTQDIGFNSRHLVLCSLPFRPIKELKYERKNGIYSLQVIGHPDYGVPYGQDRLWLIWLATEVVRQKSRAIVFKHAGEILSTFGMSDAGTNYRRLKEGLQRIFASAIFFGTENEQSGQLMLDWKRYHYLDGMTLWFKRADSQEPLPDDAFMNSIEVSQYFYDELMKHPIPVDLNVVRGLSDSPGALDFYTWIVWRCWCIEPGKNVRVPLTGPQGLDRQMGVSPYSEERRWRAKIGEWLQKTSGFWPQCPARISDDGNYLIVSPGRAILDRSEQTQPSLP